MNLASRLITTAALAFGFTSGANALVFNPSEAGSSISDNLDQVCIFFCSDVDLSYDMYGLDSFSDDLDVNDTWTFNFFDITASGIGAATVDIAADLAFASPGGTSSHTGEGGVGTFFGIFSGGVLTWNNPVNVLLGDGTSFNVSLSNIYDFGLGATATVQATVQLLSAPASVPEPGTLMLLGAGILALPFARRRRVA